MCLTLLWLRKAAQRCVAAIVPQGFSIRSSRRRYLWDADGNRFLDFSGSAAVNLIGHGVSEISAAIAEQAAQSFVHNSQLTTPSRRNMLANCLSLRVTRFVAERYFTCGLSRRNCAEAGAVISGRIGETKRYQVLSRRQSYHGSTLGALAVSGNKKRREIYLPMVRECAHVGIPYCYRCDYDCTDGCRNCGQQYAAELERAIIDSEGEAAGFIFEPVSGATLGAVTPPPGYLESVADVCRRNGVLLIADEVMTGMGRCGRNFALEHWNVAPDILIAAKGLSSGYAPLGAVIANKRVVDAIADGSGALLHGFTYNAHPISVAAGRAVLKYLKAHRLVEAADSSRPGSAATVVREALEGVRELNSVGDVRGIGLLLAVEFVADKHSKKPFPAGLNFSGRVGQAAAKRGLMVYPMQGSVDGVSGDHLLLAPPGVITREQTTWAARTLREAIEEAEKSQN